jgi:hypothetical protein
MGFCRLIYRSKVARQVRLADAEEIARLASIRNERNGLTGLLLYTPSHFIQVLEGDAETLRATYARIALDARHTDLWVVDERQVAEREFGRWGMRTLYCSAPAAALESLDAEAALALLRQARAAGE